MPRHALMAGMIHSKTPTTRIIQKSLLTQIQHMETHHPICLLIRYTNSQTLASSREQLTILSLKSHHPSRSVMPKLKIQPAPKQTQTPTHFETRGRSSRSFSRHPGNYLKYPAFRIPMINPTPIARPRRPNPFLGRYFSEAFESLHVTSGFDSV